MKLADLAQYAKQKYQIEEEYKWPDFPAYSVMRNPQTGTWIAVCIREWNESLGKTIERCDLKCGQFNIYKYHLPYFSLPFRMHGSNWLGIDIEQCSAPHLIQSLFDHAINAENKRSLKKYSDISATHIQQTTYRDTAIPAPGTTPQNIPNVPAKILEMIKLYQFGDGSFLQKCKMFYIQGMFMKDYEDDVEYECYLQRFMPTYRDLKIEQLRSYFTWRTKLRKGDYQPAPTPFVYIYIYELINQIGTDSPEDSLQKMKQFDILYHGN